MSFSNLNANINNKIFVFDIETVPDIESARKVLNLKDDVNDDEVHEKIAAYHDPSKPKDNVFLKAVFHKIAAISFAEIDIEKTPEGEFYNLLDLRTGGTEESSEEEMIRACFKYLDKNTPRIVTFNGRAFDIPVLKLRAMKYGISSSIYKAGDKWNSYMSRYSSDWHCDLHEVLTDYYAAGRMRLDEACKVFGYPGKVEVDGSSVYDLYKQGKIKEIRDYCETDVLNTYLVYLSYALHYSKISKGSFDKAIDQVHDFLAKNQDKKHFKLFSISKKS